MILHETEYLSGMSSFRSSILLATTVWCTTCTAAQDKRVCITIDDLPCANCAEGTWGTVTDKLLTTLNEHRVPGIGFVNEGKLYRENVMDTARAALLERWLDHGQQLGNHTFAHGGANRLTIQEYATDIEKGEEFTRPLLARHGAELRYFRHPFLFTGRTQAYKTALDSVITAHGYTVVPVTFDNDEYIYAYCYEHAKRDGDTALMRTIATGYLAYMDTVIAFHEAQARGFLKREMAHTLLIHANALNADHLDGSLDRLEARGYRYITVEEALADPAYALPTPVVQYGFSWIRRWMLAAGLKPPYPPDPPAEINTMYEKYREEGW